LSLNPRKRQIIFVRDNESCVNCGTSNDLTIHHRINRGAGGSKLFDGLAFLLLVCTSCNSLFESDGDSLLEAKQRGYKLSRHTSPPVNPTLIPVWYEKEGQYFLLDNNGNRTEY